MPSSTERSIISAMNPFRYEDSYTEIYLMVWFEELIEPVDFVASPFDCERHGKELWIRTMAGEFGLIEILPANQSPFRIIEQKMMEQRLFNRRMLKQTPPKLLTYDSSSKDVDA